MENALTERHVESLLKKTEKSKKDRTEKQSQWTPRKWQPPTRNGTSSKEYTMTRCTNNSYQFSKDNSTTEIEASISWSAQTNGTLKETQAETDILLEKKRPNSRTFSSNKAKNFLGRLLYQLLTNYWDPISNSHTETQHERLKVVQTFSVSWTKKRFWVNKTQGEQKNVSVRDTGVNQRALSETKLRPNFATHAPALLN